jgi:hypothetical protein
MLFSTATGFAQNNFLVLKKRNKTVRHFWKGGYIAFQLKDGQWMTGILTKIEKDSFYLKTEVIANSWFRNDTSYYSGYHYAISDIYAIPRKELQVAYINGRYQINRGGGHMHWYWVKSGWIFRAGAIGYTALDVTNGLIKNNFTFSGSKFGIAAAVFLGGVVLDKVYKVKHKIGKRYRLEVVEG